MQTPVGRPSRLQESIEDDFEGDEDVEGDGDVRLSVEDIDVDVDREDVLVKDEEVEDEEFDDFPDSAAKRRRLNSSPIHGLKHDLSYRTGQDDDIDAVVEEDLDEFDVLSSSLTEISSPTAPLPPPQLRYHAQSKPVPRFLPPSTPQTRFQSTSGVPSTPRSSSSYLYPPSTTIKPGNAQANFSKPPRFRPPSPTSQSHPGGYEDPLPDTFSPRRRGGEKYLIGGLANELRSWIFNIGNEPRSGSGMHGFGSGTSSSSNTTTTTTGRPSVSDQWKIRILIDEMSGGYGASGAGMTLIRGRQVQFHSQPPSTNDDLPAHTGRPHENEEIDPANNSNNHREVKIMLAGTGIIDGLNRAKKLDTGMQIGVRGPTWEVLVGEETWGVAVNWRVL